MTIKIGINGFGRMGRLGLRAALDHVGEAPDMRFVQVNDVAWAFSRGLPEVATSPEGAEARVADV